MSEKPEIDLTGDTKGLRWVGWNLPLDCTEFGVGSVLSIYCPAGGANKA